MWLSCIFVSSSVNIFSSISIFLDIFSGRVVGCKFIGAHESINVLLKFINKKISDLSRMLVLDNVSEFTWQFG